MGRKRVKPREIGWNVTEYELPDARPLLTIPPDSPLWAGAGAEVPANGALVRLLPPADATDLKIAELRELLENAGAAAVRTMPREKGGGLAKGEEQRRALDPTLPVREVVLSVANRMKSRDQDALAAELNATMDEAGL